MKKFILLSLLSTSAFAQAPAFCEMGQDIAETRATLDFIPEYFFKPMPKQNSGDQRQEVSIISRDGNVFLDMKTGDYRRVPGQIDGTATPDGQFMVTPMGNGLTFFDRDTVTGNSKPDFEDANNTLDGVYQSVGLIPGSAPNKVYRAITDTLTTGNQSGGTLMYKDYKTQPGPNGPVFLENAQEPKPLCSNLAGTRLKLPMISKDGQMLAAFDVNSGTTKIYNVKQSGGVSRCEVKKDLGFATGKVEFSNDGKKITFAADSSPTASEQVSWYEQPNDDQNFNVYVVDMEQNSLQRVSKLANGSAYYPSFSDTDEVVYIEQVPSDSGRDGNQYSIVRTRVDNANEIQLTDFKNVNNCSGVPPAFMSSLALGALWYNICNEMVDNDAVSTQGLAFMPLAMDPAKCRELVQQNWGQFKNDIKQKKKQKRVTSDSNATDPAALANYYEQFVGLSEANLLSACPTNSSNVKAVEVSGNQTGSSEIEGENKLLLCQQCHTPNHKYPIDFTNLEGLASRKEQIFGVVFTRHMPQGSNMSDADRGKLLEWIEKNVPGEE